MTGITTSTQLLAHHQTSNNHSNSIEQSDKSSSIQEGLSSTNFIPSHCKPKGYEFYRNVLKAPRFVVAPMVDGSELAWRILSRFYGAELCYTPMIHSGLFSDPKNSKYRQEQFDLISNEEGHPNLDRPLILQFCANRPDLLLKASQFLTTSAAHLASENIIYPIDGFDLNLGCPQGIARKGKYGAFLMDHPDLIDNLISNLDLHSPLPVTAKYRRFERCEKTQEYTSKLISAGAQIVTIHGRTRDQKGQFTGLADWKIIKAAVETSHERNIPIFGNGNILISSDVIQLINQTGADGVMSAEGNLYNPAIFAPLNQESIRSYRQQLPEKFKIGFDLIDEEYHDPAETVYGTHSSLLHFPNCTKVASQYLMICKTLSTRTSTSAIKGHLYKLFRPVFDTGRFDDLRDKLAQISWSSKPTTLLSSSTLQSPSTPILQNTITITTTSNKVKDKSSYETILDCFQEVVNLVKLRLEDERRTGLLNEHEITMNLQRGDGESTVKYLQRLKIPYSRCQPYVRPGSQLDDSKMSNSTGIVKESMNEEENGKEGLSNDNKDNNDDEQNKEGTLNGGLAKCENPNGCVNSGAIKCKWKLCKTCCGIKTGLISSESTTTTSSSLSTEESRKELMIKLDKLDLEILTSSNICQIHLKRARLELEKIQIKSQRRKLSKSYHRNQNSNKRIRISE